MLMLSPSQVTTTKWRHSTPVPTEINVVSTLHNQAVHERRIKQPRSEVEAEPEGPSDLTLAILTALQLFNLNSNFMINSMIQF